MLKTKVNLIAQNRTSVELVCILCGFAPVIDDHTFGAGVRIILLVRFASRCTLWWLKTMCLFLLFMNVILFLRTYWSSFLQQVYCRLQAAGRAVLLHCAVPVFLLQRNWKIQKSFSLQLPEWESTESCVTIYHFLCSSILHLNSSDNYSRKTIPSPLLHSAPLLLLFSSILLFFFSLPSLEMYKLLNISAPFLLRQIPVHSQGWKGVFWFCSNLPFSELLCKQNILWRGLS